MTNKVRRIVTGTNDEGKSIILMDADATNHKELMPGVRLTDIWTTESAPADNTGNEDMGERDFLFPPQSGTMFRYMEIDPGHGVDAPQWHATDTVDYIVIVKGEIYCLLDEGDMLLKAGDLLVQRGVNHAWVNRSSETCVIAGAMVSAIPLS
jgi:quercetin dioxygenase-like cupin family protein